jgi:hypothetical protein
MKVLCIKGDTVTIDGPDRNTFLKEGECYNVVDLLKYKGEQYYELAEDPECCYQAKLFIPCSNIDERELSYNQTYSK